MADPNWMSSTSEDAKQKVLGKNWGDPVYTYAWYWLGNIKSLNEDEVREIVEHCFINKQANFGDLELHPSTLDERKTVMRLRGGLHLQSHLMIRGRYCPLYQIGHAEAIGVAPRSEDFVNFASLWGHHDE